MNNEVKHPQQIQKQTIQTFWDRFGGRKSIGTKYKYIDKLNALKEFAEVHVPTCRTERVLKARRAIFDDVKTQRFKMGKIRRVCFVCATPAVLRHHIIQLQNGGMNCKKNVVYLCNPCHCLIHPWL